MKHLRYQMSLSSGVCGHPQTVMKNLGIIYQYSTPQSTCDQWWFWNCENIPDKLPEFISHLDLDPMKQVGWGLNQKTAESIRDFQHVKTTDVETFLVERSQKAIAKYNATPHRNLITGSGRINHNETTTNRNSTEK